MGNASHARTLTNSYFPSLQSSRTSRASATGSQATYRIDRGPSARTSAHTEIPAPDRGGSRSIPSTPDPALRMSRINDSTLLLITRTRAESDSGTPAKRSRARWDAVRFPSTVVTLPPEPSPSESTRANTPAPPYRSHQSSPDRGAPESMIACCATRSSALFACQKSLISVSHCIPANSLVTISGPAIWPVGPTTLTPAEPWANVYSPLVTPPAECSRESSCAISLVTVVHNGVFTNKSLRYRCICHSSFHSNLARARQPKPPSPLSSITPSPTIFSTWLACNWAKRSKESLSTLVFRTR